MSSLEWRFILPVLGKLGYHMLAPDLPGHGKSLTHQWQGFVGNVRNQSEWERIYQ